MLRHLIFSLVTGGSSPPWPWNAILNPGRLQNLRPLALSSLLFSKSSKLLTCVPCPSSLTFPNFSRSFRPFATLYLPFLSVSSEFQFKAQFFLFLKFIIGVQLIYNVPVISGVQHSGWTISFTYTPPSRVSLPYSGPALLGHQSITLSSLHYTAGPH